MGALHAVGQLDLLEDWALALDRADIIRYMDIQLLTRGGFAEAGRLMDYFRQRIGDPTIESLGRPFAAVATDLVSGEEVWLREGNLFEAVRASLALPGLLTPVEQGGRWLVDGGLVNPIPVSLCRALGATQVIAVNLNADIVGGRMGGLSRADADHPGMRPESTLLKRLTKELRDHTGKLGNLLGEDVRPGLFEVVASSVHVMQDRITRCRLEDDPADVVLAPTLRAIGLLEFDRTAEAITAGRECVREARSEIEAKLGARGQGK